VVLFEGAERQPPTVEIIFNHQGLQSKASRWTTIHIRFSPGADAVVDDSLYGRQLHAHAFKSLSLAQTL
jgi:hypothetical protein